jgi:hypothetical protein
VDSAFGRIDLMFERLRYSALVVETLSLVFLLGCSTQKSAAKVAPNGVEEAPAPTFSLNTPLDNIAADQRGKAVLDRDVPGLMASRSYILFDDMSLSQIATVSGGQLTKAKLALVQADLSQLSDQTP